MVIQFFSDLHFEFGPLPLGRTEADVIVAAGDVDVGARGVPWLKQSDKPTIYIAGNHEYYGGEIGAVQAEIRAATADTNITFLECESTVIDDVRFLGATLWTDFMNGNEALMRQLQGQMNDYQQIRYGERALEPEDLLRLNQQTKQWLVAELEKPFAGHTVVVTHHAPLYTSWHESSNDLFKGAYCNDLSEIVLRFEPALWIHGHIHSPSDYYASKARVVCNPRGYDGYQLVEGFQHARTVRLGT